MEVRDRVTLTWWLLKIHKQCLCTVNIVQNEKGCKHRVIIEERLKLKSLWVLCGDRISSEPIACMVAL